MRTHLHKPLLLITILIIFSSVSLFACEMNFNLSGTNLQDMRILPGSTIALQEGESYTLRVEFVEDHRNCSIPPEDTLFMLDGRKWRVDKSEQGIVLQDPIQWTVQSKTSNVTLLPFFALQEGTFTLSIIRDCPKGGYDETITFSVS